MLRPLGDGDADVDDADDDDSAVDGAARFSSCFRSVLLLLLLLLLAVQLPSFRCVLLLCFRVTTVGPAMAVDFFIDDAAGLPVDVSLSRTTVAVLLVVVGGAAVDARVVAMMELSAVGVVALWLKFG